MTSAARKLLEDVLRLPEPERAEIATAILASFDGDEEPGWEQAWLAELDAREEAARNGDTGDDWFEVRRRVLASLRRA